MVRWDKPRPVAWTARAAVTPIRPSPTAAGYRVLRRSTQAARGRRGIKCCKSHGMKRDLAGLMWAMHSSDPEPLGLRGSPRRLRGHPFSAASSRLDPAWRRHLSTILIFAKRRIRSRPWTDRVRPCIRRAGRVASRHVRLPHTSWRDRLYRPCEAAAGPDAGRAAQTDDEGGASRRVLQC